MGGKLEPVDVEPLDVEPLDVEPVDVEPEYGVNVAPGGGGLLDA
jgi:hypothetical protein